MMIIHCETVPVFAPQYGQMSWVIEVSRIAREKNAFVHTHASENRSEMEKVGLTGPKLILAHCIWLDEAEKEILIQSKTRISHCPSSNLKLASGIAPIPEMMKRGAEISLGADGAPCNNNLDGFREMRHAALIQKPLHGPTVMPAQRVFELATLGGARAIGHEQDLGSLEVGKKADLAVVSPRLKASSTQSLNRVMERVGLV